MATPAAVVEDPTRSVELLREFERTGRPEPFEELVRRHGGMVFATCLRVTKDPHDAEDAAQATFLTLAAKGRVNGEIREPEAWLRRVAHRLSLDLIRSRKRRSHREQVRGELDADDSVAPDSSQEATLAEHKRILHEELAAMPASYRTPLVLHYFGGLSREEMAAQLKVKGSTLGVRLHRAREQLRKRMAGRGVALPAAVVAALLAETIRRSVLDGLVSGAVAATPTFAMAVPTMAVSPMSLVGLRGLLDVVLGGKLARFGALSLLLASAGVGTPRVWALLPESVRALAPSIKLPSFDWNLRTPAPRLMSQATPAKPAVPLPPPMTFAATGWPDGFDPATVRAAPIRLPSRALEAPAVVGSGTVARPRPTTPITQAVAFRVAPIRVTPAPLAAAPTPTVSTPRPTAIAARPEPVATTPPARPPTPVPGNAPRDDWNRPLAPTAVASGGSRPGPTMLPDVVAGPITLSPAEAVGVGPIVGEPFNGQLASARSEGLALGEPAGLIRRSRVSAAGGEPVVSFESGGPLADVGTPVEVAEFGGARTNAGGLADERLTAAPTVVGSVSAFAEAPSRVDVVASDSGERQAVVSSLRQPAYDPRPLGTNAARVTLFGRDAESTTAAVVDFVDTRSTDLPTLPGGHTFVGVWQLSADGLFAGGDIEVRYDDLRAARLGVQEQNLKLWVGDVNGWHNLLADPTFGRDVYSNHVWASYAGAFQFFAVSSPEPTVLAPLIAAAAVALRRRRSAKFVRTQSSPNAVP